MNNIKEFEKYLEEYKFIGQRMEKEDLSLNEAMELYNRSQKLYVLLQDIINEAKLQVNYMEEEG